MKQLIFANQNRYDYYEGKTPKLNRVYITMIQNLRTISFRLRWSLQSSFWYLQLYTTLYISRRCLVIWNNLFFNMLFQYTISWDLKIICSFCSRKMFHWLFYTSNWDSLIYFFFNSFDWNVFLQFRVYLISKIVKIRCYKHHMIFFSRTYKKKSAWNNRK